MHKCKCHIYKIKKFEMEKCQHYNTLTFTKQQNRVVSSLFESLTRVTTELVDFGSVEDGRFQ